MNLINIGVWKDFEEVKLYDSRYYKLFITNKNLFRNVYYVLFRRECVFIDPLKITNDNYMSYIYVNDTSFNNLKIFSRKMKLYKLNNKIPKIEKNTIQCKALTHKNERCKLDNIENSYYCLLHYLLKIKNNQYE